MKRGFLLAEETLKMIIAVIAIGFLIYFLTSIYLKSQESEKLEQAKASLEHLVSEIEQNRGEVEIYNPTGNFLSGPWWVSSWPVNNMRPRNCENLGWNSCLCICNGRAISVEGYANDCDNSGTCLESDLRVEPYRIVIDNPPIKLNVYDKIVTIK